MSKITHCTLAALLTAIISINSTVAAASEKSGSSEQRKVSEKEARALAMYAPRPSYPLGARRLGATGSGVVRVNIDTSSGAVTAAWIELSTGHILLDDAALATFRQWRFKPGTLSKVRIPITFSMLSLYVKTSDDRPWLQNVTNWLLPFYPISAIYGGLTGSGAAILKINAQNGVVTSAAMLKSTGRQILDHAAIQAFRQWRFKPGTLTTLQIPIEFARERGH